jgi:hypothetical protein
VIIRKRVGVGVGGERERERERYARDEREEGKKSSLP